MRAIYTLAGLAVALAQPVVAMAASYPTTVDYSLVAGTPQTVVAASDYRQGWRIVSFAPATIYCTDDGTTPTATHAAFQVYANGQSDSSGAPVSSRAVQCVGSGAVTVETW